MKQSIIVLMIVFKGTISYCQPDTVNLHQDKYNLLSADTRKELDQKYTSWYFSELTQFSYDLTEEKCKNLEEFLQSKFPEIKLDSLTANLLYKGQAIIFFSDEMLTRYDLLKDDPIINEVYIKVYKDQNWFKNAGLTKWDLVPPEDEFKANQPLTMAKKWFTKQDDQLLKIADDPLVVCLYHSANTH